MIRAPVALSTSSTRSPWSVCSGCSGGTKAASPVALADVGAEEPDQVIDAVAVVELGAAPRARREPAESAGGDRLPAVGGKAPVLAGLGERVGRRADRRVEAEVVLPRPDVGAVAADHEREVAEHADVAGIARLASTGPPRATAGTSRTGSPPPAPARARASAGGIAVAERRRATRASSGPPPARAARGTGRSRRATSARDRGTASSAARAPRVRAPTRSSRKCSKPARSARVLMRADRARSPRRATRAPRPAAPARRRSAGPRRPAPGCRGPPPAR